MEEKFVLITGAGGGLGGATAAWFASQKWQVFAADNRRAALASLENIPNLTPVFVDVGATSSVEAAYRQVSRHTNALDGVINMAGVIEIGSMVEVEESSVQRVLNTNVMGMFRVNKTFLPLVLKARGRIINISSENGWESGGPFNGAYAMSKHAVEAYSDSLRRELILLGIKVIKIQPGPFKTDMVTTSKKLFTEEIDASTFFKPQLAFIASLMEGIYMKANPPEMVAHLAWRAMTVKNPRTAYSIRPDPQMALLELLPPRWADKLIGRMLKKH